MEHQFATDTDLPLLAEWNHQLIKDEGHRNSMSVSELKARMGTFLTEKYKALLFLEQGEAVAYALYCESESEIYLRQFFVRRDRRRRGIGRRAIAVLLNSIWPKSKRLTVEVLCNNSSGIAFWRSVGYADYALTMEIMPR